MLFGIKLIILLIFLSGLIAYLGDLLGRRIGKKKISIFSLRPRYSAIVITISTGILITLITLVVLNIVSKDARTALFGIEKLKIEALNSKNKLQKSILEIEKNRKEIYSKNEELKKLAQKIEKENENLKNLERKFRDIKLEKENLDIKLQNSRKEEEKLNLKIQELQIKEEELNAKIESLRKQGEKVFEKLKKTREELNIVEMQKKEQEKEKKQIELKLKQTKAGKIIISAGEEVARLNINISSDITTIRDLILETLSSINEYACNKGALSKERRECLVVYEEQVRNLIEDITNSKTNVLIRFLSYQNIIEGEPLYLKFDIIENRIIIKKGEVLSEEIVDPKNTQQEIEKSLILTLKKARDLALDRGLIQYPGGEIGGISALKFYNIVNLIKKSEEKLKISVFATKDTFIGDILDVDFRIKEVKN